ncbi:MAG: 50S ribosomal protein L23 [Marinilabiliaceae bacterium]|nr:50S ribosomal protein L23 [Marinilabiliaceae bacterium]
MKIIIKPIVTEKQTAHSEKLNRYGFMVAKTANKLQIKKAVEDLYNVTVESVNTIITPGKNKTRFTKSGIIEGRVYAAKKALVTLKDGDTIDFYSNI